MNPEHMIYYYSLAFVITREKILLLVRIFFQQDNTTGLHSTMEITVTTLIRIHGTLIT